MADCGDELCVQRLSYGYDNVGQLTSANGFESGGALRGSEQFGYKYDTAGNLSSRTNYALQQALSVDGVNQLSGASRSGTYSVAGATLGTPTSVTVNGSAATVFADGTFVRTNVTLSSGSNTFTAVATDALSRQDTSVVTAWLPSTNAFAYDSNGNLTSDGYRGLAYDDENRLTSVTITNATRSEFVYDGLSRQRVRREYAWVGGIWLLSEEVHSVYDGSAVIQERDRYNAPLVTYTRGLDLSGTRQTAGGIGGLLARTDHGTSTHAYYHSDAGGNIVALTDGFQNVVARYAYDPFGGTLQASGPLASANRYRFSSKEFHPGSGTYNYGYRNYDPGFQRWVNRDPIQESGGLNMYGFVGNTPTTSLDPRGLSFWTWIANSWFGRYFDITDIGGDVSHGLQDMANTGSPITFDPNSFMAMRKQMGVGVDGYDDGNGGKISPGELVADVGGAVGAGLFQLATDGLAGGTDKDLVKGLQQCKKLSGGGRNKVIGLGLDADLANHMGTGAITYVEGGWQKAGLTSVPWWKAWDSASAFMNSFREAAGNASEIRFDVSSYVPGFAKPGLTQQELTHVLSTPNLLQKTTFIQNGAEVIWNGSAFVKP